MALLSIAGVHAFYGHIAALKGVDLEIGADEVVALIGANGAGKSTLLMTICGRPQAAQGPIALAGDDITRRPTYEIMRRGIPPSSGGRTLFSRHSLPVIMLHAPT